MALVLLLHREEPGLDSLLLFGVAMALHSVVSGWWAPPPRGRLPLLGYPVAIDDATLAVLLAFLGGGVVLTVIKEERPEERESRFSTFVFGAAAYTVVLLA